MRGEDLLWHFSLLLSHGSPPHARGRPTMALFLAIKPRITPACAGKTMAITAAKKTTEDHPRMRGEDRSLRGLLETPRGSPPHARGRPGMISATINTMRITPACAGKTGSQRPGRRAFRDHPRMRGEDVERPLAAPNADGSPPHARGRQLPEVRVALVVRITPACAGKTLTLGH